MHTIRFDPSTRILHLRLSGHWTLAEFQAFRSDFLKAAQDNAAGGSFAVLSDTRDFPVQSQQVAEAFGQFTQAGANSDLVVATAIIVASVLNKMQAERTMAGPTLAVFTQEAEARAYLSEHTKKASAA